MSAFFSSVQFIVFAASLAGIIILFFVKKLEENRERRFAEGLRMRADHGALHVKAWLEMGEWYLEKTPWFIAALASYGIHIGALSFARLARTSAEHAHALADLVSHKHRFERRETKSQFLKDVSEYKNGSSEKLDTKE